MLDDSEEFGTITSQVQLEALSADALLHPPRHTYRLHLPIHGHGHSPPTHQIHQRGRNSLLGRVHSRIGTTNPSSNARMSYRLRQALPHSSAFYTPRAYFYHLPHARSARLSQRRIRADD